MTKAKLRFTPEEQAFIASQPKLEEWMFIDATLLTQRERERICDATGATFFIGTHCEKAGHRLRTKKGHCIQCDTSKIAYMQRDASPGFVYIAGSKRLGLVKIGSTLDVADRIYQANQQNYGGASDWHELFYVRVAKMGKVESFAKTLLSEHKVIADYEKNGRLQQATEMFKTSFDTAYQALARAIVQTEVVFDAASARKLRASKDF